MSQDDRSAEWGIAVARFVCGAIVGALIGLIAWYLVDFQYATVFLWAMPGAAVLLGVLGLVIGDAFIDRLSSMFRELVSAFSWWR